MTKKILEVHPNMTKVKLRGSPKYHQGKSRMFTQIWPKKPWRFTQIWPNFQYLALLGFLSLIIDNFSSCECMNRLYFQILEYYSEEGIMDVTPLTLPGQQPNLPFLQVQNNHLNSLEPSFFLRLCSWKTMIWTSGRMRLYLTMIASTEICTG